MAPLTVIFAGTPEFAVPSLKALLNDSAFMVTHVITQPDKPVGRKQLVTPPPVKAEAGKHGIPVWQPENLNADFRSHALLRPDFLVVVAYGQILSREILDFPHIAAVNVHASLLPKLRGASPIQHAILLGESKTGITIQKMAPRLDAGDILAQESIVMSPRETAATLHETLATLGADLLIQTLKKTLQPVPQNEAEATLCHKLTREDSAVDPDAMSAEEIDRRVRALVPWPGVTWNGIKLLETELQPHPAACVMRCAGGTELFITLLQLPGKKPMTGADYERGYGKKAGGE